MDSGKPGSSQLNLIHDKQEFLMKMQYKMLSAVTLLGLMTVLVTARAQDVIKIGEINSYKAQPAFLEPYKKGMELAIEEINASGGVNGKKVQLIIRDDNANPGDAVRAAEELVSREKVDVLTGSFLSHIGLALTDFAKQKKFFFLAAEPLTDKIVWQNGNRYTFRLRTSTYMQVAMLVPEAAAMKKKRWAVVYPNYEYGQSAAASFKMLLKAAQPDVEFVAEQAPPLGKVDSGSVVQAIADAKPDAIFNVLFGADLSKFVREGNTRGLFQGREVVSLLTGEPEYLDPLKDETPNGWVVTGYPWYGIQTPEHKAFFLAYHGKYKDYPRLGSVVGYSAIKSLAEGMKKAKSTDTEKLITAFRGLQVTTPFGPVVYRPEDHQSTMGAYVGRTKNEGGKGVMVNYRYLDGAKFQPSHAEVKKLRAVDKADAP
jgi:branched-chain amino acid transport system substrate-binding protein